MPGQTIYHTKFLKADTREIKISEGCSIYTSTIEGKVTVRDIYLLAGATVHLDIYATGDLIFPIVGSIVLSGKNDEQQVVACGEMYSLDRDKVNTIAISNPLEDETVNFLYLSYGAVLTGDFGSVNSINFTQKNCLVSAGGVAGYISAGVYDSRTKDEYELKKNGNSLFAYVINGSFELEERLMEHRDGLFVWNVEKIDFESLSEIAILLLIECSPFKI